MSVAHDIAVALGDARRESRAWRCRYPLHGGRSLTLRDGETGRLFVACWGRCDRLDVIRELCARGLMHLDLPANIRQVIVTSDGDDPGDAAARDCAWRWKREGRRVRFAHAPRRMDFNDMLAARPLFCG
jgi:hypothetical protein